MTVSSHCQEVLISMNDTYRVCRNTQSSPKPKQQDCCADTEYDARQTNGGNEGLGGRSCLMKGDLWAALDRGMGVNEPVLS